MKVKIDSKFLKPTDVEDGSLVAFVDEGENKETDWGIRMNITVSLSSGETKILTLNNVSKGNIIEAYGDESSDWINKKARVWVVSQMVGKEMKKVLYLTSPDTDMEGNRLIDEVNPAEDTEDDEDIKPSEIPF